MANKQARAESRNGTHPMSAPSGRKPLNVMAKEGAHEDDAPSGCSDLRHPNLPYWHPLNGPFPSD